ncbi:MAG: polyribonucleotide nucleotidyltransferase [Omnitrophica bacterium RIFCSPLOWO2_12_FULL_44_17]|uniref:Polyribonucleotide nucleotidyltransferase n=1 Tax=Candidatus Danuiimicrobium aquiferis TaxID=1801832 RepID=A0A1G1KYR0_9BACT|nr:MAG: polyribonucleotide nucleotidyltransferase [Omnitrophica bacterium RIFCSPHIGHO2_02_FULL_45_28]OGW89239.1 MAG: polyribonucleotide nucleotidyltransferase [Omnitrophica bacterium RIFCSPHIGHO2_12_FULL_44_12]OGW98038.1 MAG: polyribonucleotide nucleotidyltransferase [Omnitrophica bacterium RIFCSPLOWO2_12_FULL_44_17]OGX03518.1 MAG: polyribonucleotide nucleotidyltransferase [Omnitrophica bacterium RIFCSPLOWO2_02_FULL_44_11]
MTTRVQTKLGNYEIMIETGRVAKQSDGAVWVQSGGTVVLTTACAAMETKEGQDFFPLTVDYREKTYAAGKIPGGFFKREGKPSEREVLTSRLIDRPLRPLFPEHYINEVQVMSTVLSADGEVQPDILAIIGASAALLISGIPFSIPMGAVRVGMVDGQLIVNPSFEQLEKSDLDMVVAATEENIVMIEGGAREQSEKIVLDAIQFAKDHIKIVIALQKDLMKQCGKQKQAVTPVELPEDIKNKVESFVGDRFLKVFRMPTKEQRNDGRNLLYKETLALFNPEDPNFNEAQIKTCFDKCEEHYVRNLILDRGERPDGRGFKQIRPITCEVGVLPRTHGSALFTRGETQSLAVATLGTSRDEQRIDALEGEYTKRFMLHYNFPSFSVGEVKPNRGPGRREIGHGALAERALAAVMPTDEEFPYAVRIVSDIMESNGSSSMATVCGGTLALMDCGVPIKKPVSGIAMGLIKEGNKFKILTDIAGIEDHLGDMDFKVAGTREGITSIQMDIKIEGVTNQILQDALQDAKEARLKILDDMQKAIQTPREELSAYAPRITVIKINPEKIGELIGPGGKNIRKIIEESGATIDIEDDGRVIVSSTEAMASKIAIERIQGMAQEPEIGKIYQAKVRKIMPFGAFCEILPGTDGLLHVSEMAETFVKRVEDHMKEGDIVTVKLIGIDERGKLNLSRKQVLKEQQNA